MHLLLKVTPVLTAAWSCVAGWTERYFRNTRGTAAVEFALVATPFF